VNIIGLGLDATDIPRIAATIERYGERFTHRIFTEGEVAYCMRRRVPATHFAGRFAAKEAAMKALGTGHSHGVLWRDVEVVRHGGPPQLRLHGGAARRFAAMGGRTSLVTITHSDALALAEVLILGDCKVTRVVAAAPAHPPIFPRPDRPWLTAIPAVRCGRAATAASRH
jgi:holo-[acyl-carrier protein] synthase